MARQHHIQDHQVERLRLNQIEAFFAGVGELHRVIVRLKALLEGFGHFLLVLDDKDVHVSLYRARAAQIATDEILIFL